MTVRAVEEGVVVTATVGDDQLAFTVQPSCKGGGQWYCVTHDEGFRNQLQKDIHIGSGEHVLGWVCPSHGIEVP